MSTVTRTCMRDQIRDEIVTRILDNRYPPGTHLKELVLAKEFAVSQAPIREALRELEILGLVVSERYKGTRVRNPDKHELSEAYELRAILEERAAQLAVPCKTEDLDTLRNILSDMHKLAAQQNYLAYATAVVSFHRQIIALSHNSVFMKTWQSMLWEVRSRVALQLLDIDVMPFLEAHAKAIAALEQGDGIKAGELLRALISIPIAGLQK